ncbi:MAG: phosphate ABC transporter permease subunit PstC [Chitinophagaceae bacterium]|nr:MAG: phosphate ABC transporter permease subunit PstC [Chitinophagaceae bacterium]
MKDVVYEIKKESRFRKTLIIAAISLIILVMAFFITLIIGSIPSFKALGIRFLYGKTWDPVNNIFGAYPFLLGTLITSFLALIISIPFSVSIALFLGEYYPKGWFSNLLKNAIELIAAIPSVIYGFWGLFVLVPIVRQMEMKTAVLPYGVGILTASLILSVMVIPYAASMGLEIVKMTPLKLKEAAYSLGAIRYEVIRTVIFPYAKSGLLAGILLSLGRALGETMAVTMVIGNSSRIPKNIFAPGNTMASVVANEFTEAAGSVYLSALIELGLVLFLVTAIINIAGKSIIKRFSKM